MREPQLANPGQRVEAPLRRGCSRRIAIVWKPSRDARDVRTAVEQQAGGVPNNHWPRLRAPTRRRAHGLAARLALRLHRPRMVGRGRAHRCVPGAPRSPTWANVLRRCPACVIMGRSDAVCLTPELARLCPAVDARLGLLRCHVPLADVTVVVAGRGASTCNANSGGGVGDRVGGDSSI